MISLLLVMRFGIAVIQNMKIVLADYAGHPFQVQLARSLARRGVGVLYVYARGVGGPKGMLSSASGDPANLEFCGLGSVRQDKVSARSRVWAAMDFGGKLREVIKSYDPDAVIISNMPPEAALRAGFGAGRRRWLWWVQDCFAAASKQFLLKRTKFVGSIAIPFYGWAEKRIASRADAIVVIADSFLEHIPARARFKAKVIHNWAALDEMPEVSRENDWAHESRLDQSFNFVYSGTLALKHSPEILVELARSIADEPLARVVVVSEGPGADWVAREAKHLGLTNVRVLPFQPYPRVPEVMATADVLVALLERDAGAVSVPSKVLAYLCAGRPILAAIPEGNLARSILEQSGAGVVVPAGAAGAFVSEGIRLMADAEQRRRMGLEARRYAEETFDIERITDKFSELLVGT